MHSPDTTTQPGHQAPADRGKKPVPDQGETLDRLAGDWWIFQLEKGHRYATDDVLTAWTAIRAAPEATSMLDLGTGIGSIGLLCLMRSRPDSVLTGVEIQPLSAGLVRKTIEYNQLEDRARVVEGDLRSPEILPKDARFDLVTANPPYLPAEAATESPHPQRAAARIELHGDVFDYCRIAAGRLEAQGRFCFCHAAGDPRPLEAIARAGLVLLARQDVLFRAKRPPVIALFNCGWQGERQDPPPMIIRGLDGRRTPQYRSVRRDMWIEV